MKRYINLVAIALFTSATLSHITVATPSKITTIFFDIATLFQTDTMRASGYIGKFDSIKYIAKVGHLPSQEQLFQKLEKAPATSTQFTYNNNLKMPLIFSDWLTNSKSAGILMKHMYVYLQNSSLTTIEKKVLFSIVSMMLTPEHLADTQKIVAIAERLVNELKTKGYTLYLVGNWADIASLKKQFPSIFALFENHIVSGDIGLIKPDPNFYKTVLEITNVSKENAVWIESESAFIEIANTHDHQIAVLDLNNKQYVYDQLAGFDIILT